ncbi:hypothetical protein [Sulfobacillus thermosulfidooxidans]|uniref:hypothetical protein n=1 Tax=Sulfobacillus thermosulfidooxidans TaxID=28034 RepID=UPI0002D2E13F|nr:hypothetical protein [Sulfobacillus thermosulfidooxidans]
MAGQLPYDHRPWALRRTLALHDHTMRNTIGFVTRRFTVAKREAYRQHPELETARLVAVQEKAPSHSRPPGTPRNTPSAY